MSKWRLALEEEKVQQGVDSPLSVSTAKPPITVEELSR
jgi:hypothetical protein